MLKLLNLIIAAVLVFDSFKPTKGDGKTFLHYVRRVTQKVKLPRKNFVVTYCWTEWFDRDDPPGSGDWETLSDLHKENPGRICPDPSDVEFRTLSGLTAAEAGDTVFRGDVKSGFFCRNEDQPNGECNDYRVCFKCPSPYCGGKVCWTKWYNRDHPSGSGDWELFKNLREENPGEICDNPQNIDAVTIDTLTPALNTGENFHVYSPTKGFVCRNTDQVSCICRNYKVRFLCLYTY